MVITQSIQRRNNFCSFARKSAPFSRGIIILAISKDTQGSRQASLAKTDFNPDRRPGGVPGAFAALPRGHNTLYKGVGLKLQQPQELKRSPIASQNLLGFNAVCVAVGIKHL